MMQDATADHTILERLHTYNPGGKWEQVSLQLFGMSGHGKSSLINTCVCVVSKGDFRNVANAGESNQPITMDRKDFQLTDKIVITDNRGIHKMSNEELVEIRAQFCNFRGRDRVEFDRSFREHLNYILAFRHQTYEVIVPVFVYSAASLVTEERYKELEPFIRDVHNITGIYPVIVLTNVQTYSTDAARYYTKFREIGAQNIFQIENYTTETPERNPETKSTILAFLDTCLQEADRQISGNQMMDLQQQHLKNALYIMELLHYEEVKQKNAQSESHRLQYEADKGRMEANIRDKEERNKKLTDYILKVKKKHKPCSVM